MKKLSCALIPVLIMLLVLSSCADKRGLGDLNDLATTVKSTQIFTEPRETTTESRNPNLPQNNAQPVQNNSWAGNYALTYTYTENSVSSEITEKRCDGVYCATDNASGTVSFFSQNGSNIEQYILNPAQKSGTHSVIKDNTLDNITTGFMKIAYIDPGFTSLSNVEYQNDDIVAGRGAKKYTQSAYSSAGLLTAYAFVWIDTEYGFISKCQVYSLSGTVSTSWELKDLSVGSVTEEKIGFTTDGYEITEQEAPSD